MTLVRWDPFREFFGNRQSMARFGTDEGAFGAWAPAVDIFEKNGDLMIRAELPGVDRDDIDVDVEDNKLTISGERKQEEELSEEHTYRMERFYGRFVRSFQLPKTIDATKIAASFRDGVLELRLPKAEQARPRKISIEAA